MISCDWIGSGGLGTPSARGCAASLALDPHACGLEWHADGRPDAPEVAATVEQSVAGAAPLLRVDIALGARPVPERAVPVVGAVVRAVVVVAVERRERHAVVTAQHVGVQRTREPADPQPVVVRRRRHSERAVLGVVPAPAVALHFQPQFVAAARGQTTQLIVAEPVVAAWLAKAPFVVCPWAVEAARPVVLLDQQGSAPVYRTVIVIQRRPAVEDSQKQRSMEE